MNDPSQLDVTTKAAILLEALPYIQEFRGSIFVVKYGGAFMHSADPTVRNRVATDIALLAAVGIRVVVVHGGGNAITNALKASGLETRFEHGLRVTDEATMKIVEHTLNHVVNPEICELLEAQSGSAAGIAGNEVLVCTHKQVLVKGEPVDIGYVGETQGVNTEVIEKAFEQGRIPVISPIALDGNGHPCNTNADAAAGHIAGALNARRLVYLCDVPGLMRDISDPDSLISSLQASQTDRLIGEGIIRGGMIPKTHSAIEALHHGVHRVHFIPGELPHSLLLEIFTDQGIGTEIVST